MGTPPGAAASPLQAVASREAWDLLCAELQISQPVQTAGWEKLQRLEAHRDALDLGQHTVSARRRASPPGPGRSGLMPAIAARACDPYLPLGQGS